MKNLFLILPALLISAQTASAEVSCKLNQAVPQVISHLPMMPEWFAKISPEGDRMFWIGGGYNHLLSIRSNDMARRSLTIPGGVDPVPSPDGKLQTLPGIQFYYVPEVIAEQTNAQAVYRDPELPGVYQSVGIVSTDVEAQKTTYRVIVDQSEQVMGRDYTFDYSSGRPVMVEKGPVTYLCPGRHLKTMIISKDAKYVAALDYTSKSTKIVSTDGTCRDLADLGFPTGKVEFSYDSSRIAFHVDFFNFSNEGTYFSAVDSYRSKDVFSMLMDKQDDGTLKLHSLRRLTATMRKGAGGYYPSFDNSGRVAFLYDYGTNFAVHITANDATARSQIQIPAPGTVIGRGEAESLNGILAIGSLWVGQCHAAITEDEMTAANLTTMAMAIPEDDCKALVETKWTDEWKQQVADSRAVRRDPRFSPEVIMSLTSEKLMSLCQDTRPQQANSEVFGDPGQTDEPVLTGKTALRLYCMGCHETGAPVPLDPMNMTEYQILDSLARIHLPTDKKGRMPPANPILPYENSRGETVDPLKIINDYLIEQLAEVRKMPEALPVVAAPTQTAGQCFGTRDEWMTYLNSIASQAGGNGGFADYGAISKTLQDCQPKIEELGLNTCMSNLNKYASIRKPKPIDLSFKLGFEVDDSTYYRQLKEDGSIESLALPKAGEGIDLSLGIPSDWREQIAASNGKVEVLNYRSRTVTNPGGVGSYNRLLFYVQGEKYDKWIQFTLPEPTKFDEQGFTALGDSGPERLVDFIAIDKTTSPKRILFAQYWRDANGQNPVPRTKELAEHLLGMVPAGVPNQSDACYTCHAGGMRQLSPQPGSVGVEAFQQLSAYNKRMQGYGHLDWAGAIHPDYYGPPMGQAAGCAVCHRNDSNPISDAFTRGPINRAFAPAHVQHKLMTDMSMPTGLFAYNETDPSRPLDIGKVLAPIKYLDVAVDPVRRRANRDYVSLQVQMAGGTAAYPTPQQLLEDLRQKDFFTNLGVIWPTNLSQETYDVEIMKQDAQAVQAIRQQWLSQQLNANSTWYKREIGHWMKNSCETSTDD
jgi:hypothetical protein